MDGEGGGRTTLEFTPTWVVAVVCTFIIAICLGVERILYWAGKFLERKNQKPLFEALQKVKEELMLLGFISLLLSAFQGAISKICIPEKYVTSMLPCSLRDEKEPSDSSRLHNTTSIRPLLSEVSLSQQDYCATKHEVPLLSLEALHHLHIFVFVLAIVHVTFCALTVIIGGLRIRQWKPWEDAIAEENYDTEQALKPKITLVHQHKFIQDHFAGIGRRSGILCWVDSFLKQFYASVTKADYMTMRLGFIMTHCRGNVKFNFHKYMIRTLEDDFKHVFGISWHLWLFLIIFLLLDVNGWHTYFWIAFIPFILLLAVGTKLEHVICQLAHEVAEKHVAVEGELIVQPSDNHFWFKRPEIILLLIHFIQFQNSFEIAYLFTIWMIYGFGSCIMGKIRYIVPRLIIGVIIQVLCSYSTLPLYAIVTQMGSTFKKAIFDEHVQASLVSWAQKVKHRKELKLASSISVSPVPKEGSTAGIHSAGCAVKDALKDENLPTSQ